MLSCTATSKPSTNLYGAHTQTTTNLHQAPACYWHHWNNRIHHWDRSFTAGQYPCYSRSRFVAACNSRILPLNTNVLQWNLCGYRTRKPFLQTAVNELQQMAICLQETNLKLEHTVNVPNYKFPPIRFDRSDMRGGGVLVLSGRLFLILQSTSM